MLEHAVHGHTSVVTRPPDRVAAAFGEKILVLIFDRKSWPPHRPWLIFFLLATLASTVAFFGFAYGHFGDPTGWPGGSSLPGLIFGVLGGLIILFEFLLWFRKKVRVWRIGRAQTWLRAHIWLGLLCVPLLIYHSGFRLGGSLSTVLMVLLANRDSQRHMGACFCNRFCRRRCWRKFRRKRSFRRSTGSRISCPTRRDNSFRRLAGSIPTSSRARASARPLPTPFLVVGAVRTAGRVQGKVLETRVAPVAVPGAEALSAFFEETVDPFLRGTANGDSPLRLRQRAAAEV